MSELRVSVAGCPFVVTPAELLTTAERDALQRLGCEDGEGRPFVLHLREPDSREPDLSADARLRPPSTLDLSTAPGDGEPAAITADGERVLVCHQRFAGVIDPFAYEADVHRGDTTGAFAIEIVLRTALGCRLPLEGGLLVHTAGVLLDGGAYLFHGISGAGKSTLAAFMRDVLSDELVAVQRGKARATGFWGTFDAVDAPAGTYPLRATIELARGEGVALERLARHDATRALLRVAVVPPQPRLWSAALGAIDELAQRPAFRLAWKPSEENARMVIAAVRDIAPPAQV